MIFQPESPLPKIKSAAFSTASLHGYLTLALDLGRRRLWKVCPGASQQLAPGLAPRQRDSPWCCQQGQNLREFLACPCMLMACISALLFRSSLDNGVFMRCFLPTYSKTDPFKETRSWSEQDVCSDLFLAFVMEPVREGAACVRQNPPGAIHPWEQS